MSIIQGNAKQGSTRGFYDFPIEQSLRINNADSAYIYRTCTATGNQKVWTYSGWYKICNNAQVNYIFTGGEDSNGNDGVCGLQLNTDGKLYTYFDTSGANPYGAISDRVYRDFSSWYHFVWQVDAENTTQRLWVNGEEQTLNASYNPPNYAYEMNLSGYPMAIGTQAWEQTVFADMYVAEVNYCDGQKYDADDFGELKNGVWIPKDPSGLTYGTNGFRLSFADDAEVEAFNTVLWRGSGVEQSITGMGFKPDLVWLKLRNSADSHALFDPIRGVTQRLEANNTSAEANNASILYSFDSDGFTVGTSGQSNGSGNSYVAWGWKAGDSNVSNTDGSITSTVRANTTYGFSIVSYTGDASTNATVGHGLSSAPAFVIVKNRDQADDWKVGHQSLTAPSMVTLNQTYSVGNSSWVTPTSSVIGVATASDQYLNQNNEDYIAYCWAEKAGYSKFGSYTGNGSSDGPEVTTGFKPAFILIKDANSGTSQWLIMDGTRDTSNPITKKLAPNLSDAENSTSVGNDTQNTVNFLADGFKLTTSNGNSNLLNGNFIYAAFADTREAAFWLDQSGNDNDWQPVNLDHNDTVADSPTDNFATWNPLRPNAAMSYTNGNLEAISSGGSGRSGYGTFGMPSGKWYFETTGGDNSVGVATIEGSVLATYSSGGSYNINGSTISGKATYTTSDIIAVAYDADANTIEFFKNNVSQGSTSFAAGDGLPLVAQFNGTFSATRTCSADFGQLGFTYTPPTGYLALSTANLPDPVIDPAQGSSPEDYFNTVLYTGNDSTQSITGVGFQPDWVWIKNRNNTGNHKINDSVRGAGNALETQNTAAEQDDTTHFTSFDSDGFTLGSGALSYNGSGRTYVAWNWKANGSGVSNTDGSITSTVSANTTSGFSIVSYSGVGSSAGATVGHGLNQAPEMILPKVRNRSGDNWHSYHSALGGTKGILLNSTNAASTDVNFWNNTDPTDSVFTVGTYNVFDYDYVAYCFHSVEGFSKFGSYEGNGSTDGPFVYLGFRPAFVMIKRIDGIDNWIIFDNQRLGYNKDNNYLWPNLSNSEGSADLIDLTSNGFKLRLNSNTVNASQTHIYMAFAENPFKYSNAR